MLNDIEYFLKGAYPQPKEINGEIQTVIIKTGEPRANELGIQSILSYISTIINPSAVQGNITSEDRFYNFLRDNRISLLLLLIKNQNEYDIKTKEIEPIIDSIMNLIELFVSRTLNNLERESYSASMKSVESNTLKESKGFNIFSRRGVN